MNDAAALLAAVPDWTLLAAFAAAVLLSSPASTLLPRAVVLAAAGALTMVPLGAVGPLLGVAVAASVLLLDRGDKSTPRVAVVGLLAAGCAIAGSLSTVGYDARNIADGPESAARMLQGLATLAFALAAALLLLVWPLSTFATGAGKQRAMPLVVALWAVAAIVLIARGCGELDPAIPADIERPWFGATAFTCLVAGLLAVAHSDLRLKLTCLTLSQTTWIAGTFATAVQPSVLTPRLIAAAMAAVLAASIVDRLVVRYGSSEIADYGGLATLYPGWTAALGGSLLLLVGPLPLVDPLAGALLAPGPSVSSNLTWLVLGGGLASVVAAFDLFTRLAIGRLDRPVFSPPLFEASHGPERNLLPPLRGLAAVVILLSAALLRLGL